MAGARRCMGRMQGAGACHRRGGGSWATCGGEDPLLRTCMDARSTVVRVGDGTAAASHRATRGETRVFLRCGRSRPLNFSRSERGWPGKARSTSLHSTSIPPNPPYPTLMHTIPGGSHLHQPDPAASLNPSKPPCVDPWPSPRRKSPLGQRRG